MKVKTPDEKMKLKKKSTPGKSPAKLAMSGHVEIVEMNTPTAKVKTPKIKTPKALLVEDSMTPKAKTPKTPKAAQTPKTPKAAQTPKTPKTPKTAQTPKTPKAKTPKTPKAATETLTPKTQKMQTPKSILKKAKTPKSAMDTLTPKSQKAKAPKTPLVQTPKMTKIKTPKITGDTLSPKVQKAKTPKTPKMTDNAAKVNSVSKSSKKRKNVADEGEASPKKQTKKDNNKENKPKQQTSPNKTLVKKKKKKTGKNIKGKFLTLFLGGLDPKVPRGNIREFFTNHGIRIYEIRKKGGRRYGHVDLLNPADLDKALALNGQKIDGNKVKINAEQTHFDVKEIEVKSQTLFVKNIESTASKDSIRDLFPDAVSIKYPKTVLGKNKGFAYVKFESIEKVKEYMRKNKKLEIKGQKLVLDSVEIGSRHSEVLRIRNLDFDTTEETLKEVFTGCTSLKLNLNSDGKSHGTAVVTYETIEEAKEAQKEHHKAEVDDRNILVTFVEEEESPAPGGKKKFGTEGRWGRKKSSAYGKKKKTGGIVKKSDGKQKSFKKPTIKQKI